MRRTGHYLATVIVIGSFATGIGGGNAAANEADVASRRWLEVAELSETPDKQQAATKEGDSWRYRRQGGLWWYWLPSNKWVYWTGDRWTSYEARTYADFRSTRRSRGSSYPADQGNWGPIRYNGYGQPEYPYSQRKSGLRQLGPVPAMGGVRSLPGWGGER